MVKVSLGQFHAICSFHIMRFYIKLNFLSFFYLH